MKALHNIQKVYFLGIGGIGMSALARYFLTRGCQVYGYDKTPSSLTDELQQEGIQIHFEEDISKIPLSVDLIVYTPAVPKEHAEYIYFTEKKAPLKKRSEVLGMIVKSGKGIAVAGTHGKTTITTMISHLLKQSKQDCSAFLGGISKNYNTNLLLSDYSPYIVVEADEFDRSFLQLYPQIAVISSVDADHLDIYKNKENLEESFKKFVAQIQKGGNLIIKKSVDLNFSNPLQCNIFKYSLNEACDFYASEIKIIKGLYSFNFHFPGGVYEDIRLGLPGLFNVENAIAALSVAWLTRIEEMEIRKAILTFSGVKRRFDYRIKSENINYIDDYAHHPEELKACISSAKHIYPDKKITGIFQPHLFTRTRDFADEFARSLELLDKIILLEIYPAREKPIKGITSQMLLDKINSQDKQICSTENLLEELKANPPEVLLTLGAGDIDRLVAPIENLLNSINQ